jgi:PAS domain S-box-containing protein
MTEGIPDHADAALALHLPDAVLLRAVLDALPDAVYVKDLSGVYLYANAAFTRMFDRSREEIVGRGDEELLESRDLEWVREAERRVLESGILQTWEDELSVGGRSRTLAHTKVPYRNAAGEVMGLIGMSRDVTDRRAVERAQRENDERLRAVVESAPVLMWTTDAEGRFTFFNRQWLLFRGRTLDEERATERGEAVHPDERENAVRAFTEAVRVRAPVRADYRLRGSDGEYRRFLEHAVPRFDVDGTFAGYVGACVDITDRLDSLRTARVDTAQLEDVTAELEKAIAQLHARTTEAELARAEAERAEERARLLAVAGRVLHSSLDYETTLRSVAEQIVPRFADWCTVHLVDERGEVRRIAVTHADPAMLKWAEEVEARYPADPGSGQGVYTAIRTGEPLLYSEITEEQLARAARDEEHLRLLRQLDVRSAMIVPMIVGSRVLGAIALLSSVPDRRYVPEDLRLMEDLAARAAMAIENARLYHDSEQANRAKSEFLATMSHELRTPLNAIMGYADLLQITSANAEQRSAHVDRIKASAWHLLSIIEEILSFSRIEAGVEQVAHEVLDAADVAREAASMVLPAASQKRLDLVVQVPEALRIRSDRAKFRQILLNLLSNAIKFTEKGQIVLAMQTDGPHLLLQVRDTGIGIDAADQPHIFEPFWQVDRGIRRRAGGTGLGLTVTKHLAELLGGAVTIESAKGGGSTFTVRLTDAVTAPAPTP